ncbi:acetyl-CoA synthetase-like protein [Rhizodiscina lignyota]|uniref:Acetyl-CoA synthetase-like protein n=1 Tax=Rhizodiscina lignyota TaxID=1504668 RepID=A0A9P4IRT9_9PEZI|nr:acetyl-CoA synthetase-like protein [Rhizodiscina lignyota]
MGSTQILEVTNLHSILLKAATNQVENGITVYSLGSTEHSNEITYTDLLDMGRQNAKKLLQIEKTNPNKVVLLHFDDHMNSIVWFWSTVIAGFTPAISTPFTQNASQHQNHLHHLEKLLDNPLVITTERFKSCFDAAAGLTIRTVENISKQSTPNDILTSEDLGSFRGLDDPAVLMLTSGSTGNAKAVCLRNRQILAAIESKSEGFGITSDDVFLNWINLDHVANLTESHLHALYHNAAQVHVHATDLLTAPPTYLELISRHRATFTFAPNFFLASLNRALDAGKFQWRLDAAPDVSSLRAMTSGGEALVVKTGVELMSRLRALGAPERFIFPGFGMTETCAGTIHNMQFPAYELANGHDAAVLGKALRGAEMRIASEDGTTAAPGTIGRLELKGPAVFQEYLNDAATTNAAFTLDGWFVTGDMGIIDGLGNLRLAGRAKDVVNINGVKHALDDLRSALEEAKIPGVAPSYTVVFAYRPKDAETESVVVVYLPSFAADDIQARSDTDEMISRTVMFQCNAKPFKVVPLDKSMLEKSSLGKLSATKVRTRFENGEFAAQVDLNDALLRDFRASAYEEPRTKTEIIVHACVARIAGVPERELSVTKGLLDMGVSSMEVIQLKKQLQDELGINEISFILILTSRSIRSLAAALEPPTGAASNSNGQPTPEGYDPLVVLQPPPSNTATPLWLVHPGAGEVLVYLNLAKYFAGERAVYALRARGFDGEPFFASIPQCIDTYVARMRAVQPHGPYAILGYSFGSMFAVEMAKMLRAAGQEVRFLGVLNLPPHIKQRIRQLNMTTAVLTLALFLQLVSDDDPKRFNAEIDRMHYEEVLDEVLRRAPEGRMKELAMDRAKLLRWAEVSNALHAIAWDYEPEGSVEHLDVFVAHPLAAVANNKEEWFEEQLTKWKDFSNTPPRFHDADGEHFSMIGAEHVRSFQKKLKAAMAARGV